MQWMPGERLSEIVAALEHAGLWTTEDDGVALSVAVHRYPAHSEYVLTGQDPVIFPEPTGVRVMTRDGQRWPTRWVDEHVSMTVVLRIDNAEFDYNLPFVSFPEGPVRDALKACLEQLESWHDDKSDVPK